MLEGHFGCRAGRAALNCELAELWIWSQVFLVGKTEKSQTKTALSYFHALFLAALTSAVSVPGMRRLLSFPCSTAEKSPAAEAVLQDQPHFCRVRPEEQLAARGFVLP